MKCKHCDGDGVIVDVEYGHAGKYMCDYCWGTGVVEPLTEQEYLQTCTTEQLAEVITDIVWECKEQDDCMDCKLGWCSKDYVVEWLKQPHTNE